MAPVTAAAKFSDYAATTNPNLLACLQAGMLVIDGKIRVCSDGKTWTT
jgi:hypothetical protein